MTSNGFSHCIHIADSSIRRNCNQGIQVGFDQAAIIRIQDTQLLLGLFSFGDIDAQFKDEGRAIDIIEGVVENIIISAIGTSPLPTMRRASLQHFKGITILTRLAESEKVLITISTVI